ncbi:MAG: hypothetical protein WBO36_13470 [Saprospiraceae bacterium]
MSIPRWSQFLPDSYRERSKCLMISVRSEDATTGNAMYSCNQDCKSIICPCHRQTGQAIGRQAISIATNFRLWIHSISIPNTIGM